MKPSSNILCLCVGLAAAAVLVVQPAAAASAAPASDQADLKPVSALLATAKAACTPTKARKIGNPLPIEVACADGSGLIVVNEAGKPAAHSCVDYYGGVDQCRLTDKTKLMAWLTRTASTGKRPCKVANFRFLAPGETGGSYYELSCRANPGLVLQTTAAGRFASVVDCAQWKWRHTSYRCTLPVAGRGAKT